MQNVECKLQLKKFFLKNLLGPGRVAQLARTLSAFTKAAGSIPGSGHVGEFTNERINQWNDKLMSLCLPPAPFLSKINFKKSTPELAK